MSLKHCFLSPCPCVLSHLLAYPEEAPWPGWHVDSGLVHSTLLYGSTLPWWRQGWQPCETSPRYPCRWRFCPRAVRVLSSSNSSRTGSENPPCAHLLPACSSSHCLVSAELPLQTHSIKETVLSPLCLQSLPWADSSCPTYSPGVE